MESLRGEKSGDETGQPGARRAGEGFMAAATAAQAANGIVQPPNQPPANPMPGAMPDEIIEAD